MATVRNNTLFVPSLNGSLVKYNDCTIDICSLDYGQLHYLPSKGANIAYLVIFALLLLAHLVQGVSYRTWGFLIGMFCGLLLEIVGYVGRVGLHNNIFSFNNFVVSLVCLTIAPAFLSAAIYLCISRLAIVYGRPVARFSPKVYTAVFVSSDVLSLVLQAAGGAIAASTRAGSGGQHTGINVMIAGLAIQAVSLILFIGLSLDLIVAAHRARRSEIGGQFGALRGSRTFSLFVGALVFATVVIFVRSCFRLAELREGFGGSVANNQALFLVFEGPMIMLAVLALAVFHPGRCFGGPQGWRAANWTWKKVPQYPGSEEAEGHAMKPLTYPGS